MTTTTINKLSAIALASSIAFFVSACNQQPQNESPAESANPVETMHEHAHDAHEHHHHNHDHHDHNHDHHHHGGDIYLCQDKPIIIESHEHDGESVTHAIIDDIEYDFYTDDNQNLVTQAGPTDVPTLLMLDTQNAALYDFSNSTQGAQILECSAAPEGYELPHVH